MTLQQLSNQYQEGAQLLQQRIVSLRLEQARCGDRESAELLQQRIRQLEPLQRESRQLAELTARYYDRGYRKNAHYTLRQEPDRLQRLPAADFADALYRRYERDGHRQGADAEQIHRVPVVEPQHGEAVQVPAVQFVKIGS